MKLVQFKQIVNQLDNNIVEMSRDIENVKLKNAMQYSLSNGGKRVRPLLLLATIHALGGNVSLGLPAAGAIEFIHTYSLIHDDLPAMDNDDYRRGQLTNHKKFDEATAILAGDALLTEAFSLILKTECSETIKLQLIELLSQVSGGNGMIGGQMLDMASEGYLATIETLKLIHTLKTSKLLEFCTMAGGLICNQSPTVITTLQQFATEFGLAFQIHNDIIDIEQDEKMKKSTYVSILGISGAKKALTDSINQAINYLNAIKKIVPTFDVELMTDFLTYVSIK